jgi:peptidoglycan/xylan/chitin deacetylase (PgdA/CDA1 family)
MGMDNLRRFWKLPAAHESALMPYEEQVEYCLREGYLSKDSSRLMKFYYLLKPVIPRSLQIALRRRRARRTRIVFPDWPGEEKLELIKEKACADLPASTPMPFIWFWPDGKEFAFVITHDVETEAGIRMIPRICEIEKKLGFRSAWYFVPERYRVDPVLIATLKDEGFEVGLHGLKHDGRLFDSRKIFDQRMSRICEYARQWGASGFRSPSLHRRPDWIKDIPFEYDSSYPDTDPYEPQPGGCLSVFPYFIGPVVELPVTLAQDHTLFEILGHKDISMWKRKLDWIEERSGMALLLVHPDYMIKGEQLKFFDEFLNCLRDKKGFWHARPVELSRWWRDRDRSTIEYDRRGRAHIKGPVNPRALIRFVHAYQAGKQK